MICWVQFLCKFPEQQQIDWWYSHCVHAGDALLFSLVTCKTFLSKILSLAKSMNLHHSSLIPVPAKQMHSHLPFWNFQDLAII